MQKCITQVTHLQELEFFCMLQRTQFLAVQHKCHVTYSFFHFFCSVLLTTYTWFVLALIQFGVLLVIGRGIHIYAFTSD